MLETPVVSPNELFSSGQIRLAELSVFNWGSFHGLHTAKIDPDGTLITGDNGAGKPSAAGSPTSASRWMTPSPAPKKKSS